MRSSIAVTVIVCLLSPQLHAQEQEDDENNSLEQSSEESTAQTTEDSSNETTEPTNDSGEVTQEMLYATSTRDPNPDSTPTPEEDDDRERDRLVIGGLALLVVVLAVVAVLSWTRPPRATTATKHDRQAKSWLAENREQLRIDLALGEGPTIEDLAAVYRVPAERHAAFGIALKTRRAELLDLANGSDARAFLRRVGEVMEAEPALHEDFVRWRMVVGATEPSSVTR